MHATRADTTIKREEAPTYRRPPTKATRRRLGHVEDLLWPRGGDWARVERFRRRMERQRQRQIIGSNRPLSST